MLKVKSKQKLTQDCKPLFSDYTCPDDYIKDGVIPIEPMTAKEIMEKDIEKVYDSKDYIVEEKIDGVRGNIQFMSVAHCRVFTRRQSVVTNFYGEKSDNLPQIRDIHIPDLEGTIIDGEMIVPHTDFKTVSSILNCLPEEAIERQMKYGEVVFKAFDCLYINGKNIMNESLKDRKIALGVVMKILKKAGITCIQEIPYFKNDIILHISAQKAQKAYDYARARNKEDLRIALTYVNHCSDGSNIIHLNKQEYFDYIVATGGEGVMIKDLNAPYEMKRTRAYQKIKKKLTRDVVILGFNEPTKEYKGKFPNDHWDYWELNGKIIPLEDVGPSATEMIEEYGCIPVTKNYYEGKVGAIVYGVKASEQFTSNYKLQEPMINCTPAIKFGGKEFKFKWLNDAWSWYIIVGECEGMTDEERTIFTENKELCIGKVIEVECNEVFKDTGKMRHPRYMRLREDKSAEECTWEAHIE